jgi:hypothetical protein
MKEEIGVLVRYETKRLVEEIEKQINAEMEII